MTGRSDNPGARAVEPHLFIVFGGTGDLARRKLLPAVFRLQREHGIGARLQLLAVARSEELDDDSYRDLARDAIEEHLDDEESADGWCRECLHYAAADDGDGYASLAGRVERLERDHDLPGNRVFYLALPPGAFADVITKLDESGLAKGAGWTRLVIEKPFGQDLASARELNELVHRHFAEKQIFRIDHFLGKETVQNLLVFRFANMMFESLWHRERVDNVQITVAETLGVEGRGSYFDRAGALRDMLQNHLTQLVSLIAMEAPSAYSPDTIRFEKIKVLRAIRPIPVEHATLGQYTSGRIDGDDVAGYRNEPDVAERSQTETFAALRLDIDNWRWQGVPFYLRSGKRMRKSLSEIAIVFRRPPVSLFESLGCGPVDSNVLYIRLQPDPGLTICFDVKRPGEPVEIETRALDFRFNASFEDRLPDAYETLLLDILSGDQTLFVHADETEAAWRLYSPLLERRHEVHRYEAGSWGPAEADGLLARSGHHWRSR